MSYAPLKRAAAYTPTDSDYLAFSAVCEVWIHAAVFDIYIKICLRFAGRRFVDPGCLTFAHKYSSVSSKIRIDPGIKSRRGAVNRRCLDEATCFLEKEKERERERERESKIAKLRNLDSSWNGEISLRQSQRSAKSSLMRGRA